MNGFHAVTREWFTRHVGQPSPPQVQGWPVIQSGRNCLITAPTGSGKTLSAFLAGLDMLYSEALGGEKHSGVQILYISPLKALNYDIERNLRVPLKGMMTAADELGYGAVEISVGVRTGDTPSADRQKMLRKPPSILITTPESLNLMLTSQAQKILGSVRQVIVDEIHSMAANKRGAFLSVLLERLENIVKVSPVRIGLSATIEPLERIAEYLGGYDDQGHARPVTIVDARGNKKIDVEVTSAVPDLYHFGKGELWPTVEQKLLEQINSHRSTIVFTANRRKVESLTLELNELAGHRLVEPHHGSISRSRRKETEERLKSGDLKAVIATSTLEMGIDMGAVEKVCQIESPKTVSSGLQRVGRAGHLLGSTSKGTIYATSLPDLLEAAAIGNRMLAGDVEEIHLVRNPLDVLGMQAVAMVGAQGTVSVRDVFMTVRRSANFCQLPEEALWRTLEMMAGRFGRDFEPKISLDRVNSQLHPLPGTLRAVVTGGVIPDTGQFPVYLSGTRLSVGELDEEFVFEAREGESFRLGTSLWRIEKIEADRIFVNPTAGVGAKTPFWRGEQQWRDIKLGKFIGNILNKAEHLSQIDELSAFLEEALPLTTDGARNLADFIDRQRTRGNLPTDQRLVIEQFQDQLGDWRLVVVTTLGGKVHHGLRIALVEYFRQKYGVAPESMASDNGLLMRLETPVDDPQALIKKLTPQLFEKLLKDGILQSPLFGLRFRQNAARALLLPGSAPGRRNPLWLQRLKAKDLLQAARGVKDFPLIAETVRECLEDYLDIQVTRQALEEIQAGRMEISVSSSPTPSPFAASMEFQFNAEFMYVWDRPVGKAATGAGSDEGALTDLLLTGEGGVSEDALRRLRDDYAHSVQGSIGTRHELAEMIRIRGEITTEEAVSATSGYHASLLQELSQEGVIYSFNIGDSVHWALKEDEQRWENAITQPKKEAHFWEDQIVAFFEAFPCVPEQEFVRRYKLDPALVHELLEVAKERQRLFELHGVVAPYRTLDAARRITLAIRRSESRPVHIHQYQRFCLAWQFVDTTTRLTENLHAVDALDMLAGYAAPAELWEADLLPARIEDYSSNVLDGLLSTGQIVWRGQAGGGKSGKIAFFPRLSIGALPLNPADDSTLDSTDRRILERLESRGASFSLDVALDVKLSSDDVESRLRKMIWSGHVTQDGFGAVRNPKPQATVKDKAKTATGSVRQRYQQLKRLHPSSHPVAQARWWSVADAAAVIDDETVEFAARMLLERYGVLMRDINALSGWSISWQAMYKALEKMELSGEIERGYYIADMGGAQFALKEAAEDIRKLNTDGLDSIIILHSMDPALVVTGEWKRTTGNYVGLFEGQPALLIETAAKALTTIGPEHLALRIIPHLRRIRRKRLEIESWNGENIRQSVIETELRSAGFTSTPNGMVLE